MLNESDTLHQSAAEDESPHWGEACGEFSGARAAAGETAEGDGAGEGEGAEQPEEGEEGAHPHRSDGKDRGYHFYQSCLPTLQVFTSVGEALWQ